MTAESPAGRSVADDVAAIGRIDAVPSILDVVCKLTGLRFAAVARVTETTWIACAVRDEIEFGLKAGNELVLETTICNEIRSSRKAVVIDHVSEDPLFSVHATPKMYGFQSYISYPIIRSNGDFFGTLCALDPLPSKLSDPKTLTTFELFSQLISLQLDADERLRQSQQALLDERQTAELREQFIAVLGHDLRTPLSSVMTGAEVLLKSSLPDKAVATVRRIMRSVERMTKLVDNVLDFARGRLGGGLPIVRQTDAGLGAVLIHVVAELSATYPERRIDLQLDVAQPVSCDPDRIAQLLSNLLANAITHGAGDTPVQVTASCKDDEFVLAVTNHGNPISPETRARLFMPFTKLNPNRSPEGLGLGLYIASQIALAHRGALTVDSLPERTTFTLNMPSAG